MNAEILIPSVPLKVMLADEVEFSNLLRYGLEYFQDQLNKGKHNHRLDGFKGHAMWFASCETPIDALGLLWQSSNPLYRTELIRVLRRVVNVLPPWDVDLARDEPLSPPLTLAATVVAFVRVHSAIELVTALQAKSFARCWWMKSSRLSSGLLLTMYSLDYAVDVHEFLGQVIDHEQLLKAMSYEQFSMFCLAYISGLVNLDRNMDGLAAERLGARLKALDKASNEQVGRPSPALPELDGRMDEIRTGLEEALAGANFLSPTFMQLARSIVENIAVPPTTELNEDSRHALSHLMERLGAPSNSNAQQPNRIP